MTTKELIICQCLEELSIDKTTTCPKCSRVVYTSKELREQRANLDAQAHALKVASQQITIELHLRNIRRPSRPFLVKEDFFWGPNGRVKGVRPNVTNKEKRAQEKKG